MEHTLQLDPSWDEGLVCTCQTCGWWIELADTGITVKQLARLQDVHEKYPSKIPTGLPGFDLRVLA